MVVKRYEYWTRYGKEWTQWFPWNSENRDPWQLKNRLKNEYKEIDEGELDNLNNLN